MQLRTPTFSLLVAGLLASASAGAHQLWLEQNAQSASLYFGEFGDNLREVSPGLLDKFVQPSFTLLSSKGERELEASKSANAFVLPARAAGGDSIVAEENAYPLLERKTGDLVTRTAWTPAARLISNTSAQAPKLTLDIVPTGKAGEFKVYYQGKALAKTKVGAVAQSGWAKEAYSDEQGLVSFALPWRGTYVLEVHHTDKTPGQRAGKPYDIASFVTSMTLQQDQGVEAVPAPPLAKPNVDKS